LISSAGIFYSFGRYLPLEIFPSSPDGVECCRLAMERLILVRLDEALPLRGHLLDVLEVKDRERATRYRREEDQTRFALGRLLISRFVGTGSMEYGDKGKPFLAGRAPFNLSHSGNFVGLYVGETEVGLDVEEISRCHMDIVSGAFTKEEAASIHDQESFAYAWTRKEAVTKCLGSGISRPSELGLIKKSEGVYQYLNELYRVSSFALEGHVLSMAKQNDAPFPEPEFISPSDLI